MNKINVDGLLSLTPTQIKMIYLRCRGETVDDIAQRLVYGSSTLYKAFKDDIYPLLGVEGWKDIEAELCKPLLRMVNRLEDLDNWPEGFREKIEALKVPENDQKEEQKAETPITDQQPAEVPTSPEPSENKDQQGRTRTRIPWPIIGIPLLILCVLCIVGAFAGRQFLTSLIANSTTPSQAPASQPTRTTVATQRPTNTLPPVSTNTLTNTPIPTDTSLPTDTSTPSLTPTQTPNPNTLFSDDFSDGLDSAWTTIFGKAVVVDGQLTATESTMLSVGSPDWTDYEIQFDVWPSGCRTNAENSFLGVRVADRENMLAYLFAGCDNQWYYVENGNWTKVPGTFSGNWQGPAHLTFTINGSTITLYNRANKIHSFVDTEYKMGYILLHLRQDTVIDNFVVTQLNP